MDQEIIEVGDFVVLKQAFMHLSGKIFESSTLFQVIHVVFGDVFPILSIVTRELEETDDGTFAPKEWMISVPQEKVYKVPEKNYPRYSIDQSVYFTKETSSDIEEMENDCCEQRYDFAYGPQLITKVYCYHAGPVFGEAQYKFSSGYQFAESCITLVPNDFSDMVTEEAFSQLIGG